jgi:flagellar protein FliJ
MNFRFRFDSLLAYRTHRKERAEAALGRAVRRLNRAREEKDALKTRRQEAGNELRGLLKGEGSANLLANYADFITEMERRIHEQERVIAKRGDEMRRRLEEVLERTREARIMEKLKEKDHEAWLHEQRRQEQKELDETAMLRHGKTSLLT